MEDPRARSIFNKYKGKPQELALHLIGLSICEPNLVYKVFTLLNEYSRIDVGIRFLNAIGRGSLYRMTSTYQGYVLGALLIDVIEDYRANPGRFRSDLPVFSPNLFQSLRFAVMNADIIKNVSEYPRKLTECEIDYYVNYGKNSRFIASRRRRPFNKSICWQLPRRGTGFVVYSPDDMTNAGRTKFGLRKVNDRYGYDQIGTKKTIFAMIEIAKKWHSRYPKKLLQYGDVSRPGGIDTPDHGTHNVGMAWDMRIPRKDNSLLPMTIDSKGYNRQYDRSATRSFIKLCRALYPETSFYFNDPVLIKEFGRQIVDFRDKHSDHLHVMPFRKGRE